MSVETSQDPWVTNDPDVLQAFLAQGRERYRAIEQALEPLAVTVVDLKGDWDPRQVKYWTANLDALLALRTAAQETSQLFDPKQSSQEHPVPLIFSGTNWCATIPLRLVGKKIEEAGIVLTSYLEVSDSYLEEHLQQRQRVLERLQAVVEATREAVSKGRAELDQAPVLHVRLTYAPGETTEVQQ